MYFLLKIGIFQPAMLVYQRVVGNRIGVVEFCVCVCELVFCLQKIESQNDWQCAEVRTCCETFWR